MDATPELLDLLNDALAREMRAQAMYAHYAAYVKGIHRLHLKTYFEGEAAESALHAQTVRNALVRLGGVAVTERHTGRIIETHPPEAFEGMRRAGRLAAECLDMLTPEVGPGVTTKQLDDLARVGGRLRCAEGSLAEGRFDAQELITEIRPNVADREPRLRERPRQRRRPFPGARRLHRYRCSG